MPDPDPHGYQAIIQSWPPSRDCRGLTEIALARPTRIVVASDAASAPLRDSVLDELRRDLEALGGPAHDCGGPSWLGCWATNDPAARNLMFVLAGDDPPSDELKDAVREWIDVRGFEAVGVVRAGADPDHVLPAALRRLNALMWHEHPLEIVAEISDAVLLDAEDRRIFISYARADGSLHADRIFEILTRSRFDVFLDRFHIPPGGDFIERIEDEIVDKSMVIVVETQAAARSHWVRQEVAIASKRGIAIAAVNLDRAPPTPSIDERSRFRRGTTNELQSFLLRQHRIQLAHRRKAIRDSVWHALCDAGADPTNLAQSALGFSLDVGGRRRVIGVSVRPADLYRFRVLDEEAQPDKAFLVHPQPALHRRRRDLAWLSDQSGVIEVDAGRIIDAAATMVAP